MSVLIKGIEMPTENDELRLIIHSNGQVIISHKTHYEEVEAVLVPPHGRLIDADAYENLIRGLGNREYRRENGTICDAIKFLHPHYTPTIIEAEEATQKDGGQNDV